VTGADATVKVTGYRWATLHSSPTLGLTPATFASPAGGWKVMPMSVASAASSAGRVAIAVHDGGAHERGAATKATTAIGRGGR
jgi:hypothetical protein